jgi:hypothetical protein
VPRHVARLVTRLVAPLVIDYSASRRPIVDYSASRKLVVDYFASVRASGCLGMSRGSSRGSLHRSSWTTPRRAGSSSTTSPPPRVRVPRHVAQLVTRLVAPLVVDYFASTAHLGASARRAVHHTARRAARRRLLRLA